MINQCELYRDAVGDFRRGVDVVRVEEGDWVRLSSELVHRFHDDLDGVARR